MNIRLSVQEVRVSEMTPYQRAQAIRLRLLREELRGRIAPDTERVYEQAQELWQVEDRIRFAISSGERRVWPE